MNIKETIALIKENPRAYSSINDDEQNNLFTPSWGVNPGFRKLYDQLDELIPLEGKVPFSRSKNKALEKLRVAGNLVYDLFNNGLINRRSHFHGFFGWAPYTRGGISQHQFDRYNLLLEPIMTQLIIDAAKEQGIK